MAERFYRQKIKLYSGDYNNKRNEISNRTKDILEKIPTYVFITNMKKINNV